MTTARRETYDNSTSGLYHCTSRCVRRAFLCGKDRLTGKNFEHRRSWIKQRLSYLLNIFAVDCVAYAVMSNHLHTVLINQPKIADTWSAEEVARRWRTLFPRSKDSDGNPAPVHERDIEAITSNPKLVTLYRSRLSDLSWFNRCMNENIARRANVEDECTGRFWEGRFKCQKLVGDAAVIASSVYVDLNPIRAGVSKTPEESDFTSIQDRINAMQHKEGKEIYPRLVSFSSVLKIPLTTQEYITLVDETGRLLVKRKASISLELIPILARLGIKEEGWIKQVQSQSKLFYRVVGSVENLKSFARQKRRCWFKGLGSARAVFI